MNTRKTALGCFPEVDPTVQLRIDTHVPEKWLFVDTETGDVWQGTSAGSLTKFYGGLRVTIPKERRIFPGVMSHHPGRVTITGPGRKA